MRSVVYKGREYEVYAIVQYQQMRMVLTKQTGKETVVHRPVPIDKLLLGRSAKIIYHDASAEKFVVKPYPYIHPYYEGLKWMKLQLYDESDFRILPIGNNDAIITLKQEEVI